jgi:hypothetical protein
MIVFIKTVNKKIILSFNTKKYIEISNIKI